MIRHIEDSGFLSKNQHGFRSGMSCLTQLLEYLYELENALDNGDCIDTVYLDCSKSFATVPHPHLLTKLQAAGIDGKVASWIKAFVTDRKQRVCIRGVFS